MSQYICSQCFGEFNTAEDHLCAALAAVIQGPESMQRQPQSDQAELDDIYGPESFNRKVEL